MSSDVNQQAVDQTKQQIRGLVSEIAQLAKSDMNAEEFYAAFMQRIVSALAAPGGAIWLTSDEGEPDVAYQINMSADLLDAEGDSAQRHSQLVNYIARSNEAQLIPPQSGFGEEGEVGNPTDHLLVLAPLESEGKVEGVVEVFQRANSQPAIQRGYLRFLVQMCELAGDWLKSQKLRQFSDRNSLWAQADTFSRIVHHSLDLNETAFAIANEGRQIIGCDRVSVAIRKGDKCKVRSVSGQDTVENRSNVVTLLGKLATRVMRSGEPMWYSGDTEDLPPQIEEVVDEYVDESYTRSLVVLPLKRQQTKATLHEDPTLEEMAEGLHDDEYIGALIVEQIESNLPRELIEPRIDLVYEHSCRAINNSMEHSNIFMMPIWRTIGKSRVLVRARTLPKTLVISSIILALLCVMIFVKKDFWVESDGVLQPVNRHDVFVPANGIVASVEVQDQDVVEKGDVLLVLEDPDLQIEKERVSGQLEETREQISTARRRQFLAQTPADKIRISGQIGQLTLREKTLVDQLALISKKEDRLKVLSPSDGQVILQWDIERSLLYRPVAVGQVVMAVVEVADQDEWEIELAMPERRMGHLLSHLEVLRDGAEDPVSVQLEAQYVLAVNPSSVLSGQVKLIRQTTQVQGEDGTVVPVLVKINKDDVLGAIEGERALRPGMTVTGEVLCGREAIGYVWFHEMVQWVQYHLLF